MTVRIVSSTDTAEQVTAALGKDAPKKDPAPKEPAAPATESAPKVEEPKAQEAATETAPAEEPAEGEEQVQKEGDPPPKKKGGFQKKIDKLTRRAQEAELELAHTRRMLEERNGGKPAEPKKDTPAADPTKKPLPDDFDTHAEYIEAVTDWKVEQKLAESRKKEAAERELAARGEKVKSWQQRLEKAREVHEDFDEALAVDVPVSPAMMEGMVESELGAEIAYWLGKNPAEARRIAQLSPTATARELGKIEARLETPKEEAAPAVQAKTATSVKPKPVAPVGGRATPTAAKDPDKMSFQEFKKWRESQLNAS